MKKQEFREKIISGIQQMGIGVSNLKEAWRWYKDHFGTDVRIFEEKAKANLMFKYTGGVPQERHAALAMNLQGGGGLEIWQYTKRKPSAPSVEMHIGDLGINMAKIKCKDVRETHSFFKEKGTRPGELRTDPRGKEYFFVRDPFNNLFQMVEGNGWFKNEKKPTGAIYGAIIGVTDIQRSRILYSNILGYDEVVYDEEGVFDDLRDLSGGDRTMRRVLLKHSRHWRGSFSRLFGPSQMELIQVKDRNPRRIFENRFWGDLGFIHLCYDVTGMKQLKKECESNGFPFKVDSSADKMYQKTFDMGEAAGHFSYVEDPDGTLIEFVETHRIPLIKKLRWYINLQKRKPGKNLPNWMIKALSFNRVKL